MARIPLLQKPDVDPMVDVIYQKIEDSNNKVINLLKALAHSPKVCRDWHRLGVTLLLKGKLSPKLRELAILRVGDLAQATYEWTQHVPIGLMAGLTQKQIDDLPNWETSTEFNEEEQAVLRYTDEVAQQIRASEEAFGAIKTFFDHQEVVELTVTIGYYGMVCRTLEALQIELEE